MSNGRPALSGLSRRRDRAPILARPAIAVGVSADSLPPARTMSHSPLRSMLRATPRAVVPDAQAVAVTRLGPRAPQSMAT